jgi:hypothetical protein
MAGGDKRDDQLQVMQKRVGGLAMDIQMIHARLDSMTTSSTVGGRVDQLVDANYCLRS